MKFSLALLAASVLGADKEISEARLLASKKTDSKILAQNQELTFSYKIYNVGSQEAFDVVMEDENFNADDFEIVSGEPKKTWDSIGAGASMTHEITVRPLKAGSQNITSAILSYSQEKGGEEIKLFSSDYGSAQIIEESEYLRKHASHLQDWVVFFLLCVPSIVFPYLLYNKSKSKYEKKKSA